MPVKRPRGRPEKAIMNLEDRMKALALRHQTLPVRPAEAVWNHLLERPGARANLIRLKLHLDYLKRVVGPKELKFCDINYYINFLKEKLLHYSGPTDAALLLAEINKKKYGYIDRDTRDSIMNQVEHISTRSVEEQRAYVAALILEKFADEAHEKYTDAIADAQQKHEFVELDFSDIPYEDLSLAATFNMIERQYYGAIDLLKEAIKRPSDRTSKSHNIQRLAICYYQIGMVEEAKKLIAYVFKKDPRGATVDKELLGLYGLYPKKLLEE